MANTPEMNAQRKLRELEAVNRVLEERANRLGAIIATEPECVKLLGVGGVLLDMNPAGLRMIEADSLEQVRNWCVYPLIVEEHREAFRELTEQVLAGDSGTLEFRLRGLKGGFRWLETHATPLRDREGNVTSLLAITRDVTQRKEAEEAARRMLHRFEKVFRGNLAAMSINTTRTGRLIDVNDSYCRFFGYRREELIGKTVLDLQLWDDPAAREPVIERLLREGSLCNLEARYRQRSGAIRDVLVSLELLDDRGDADPLMISIFIDITERKSSQEELRRSEERLRQLIEYSSDLITIVNEQGVIRFQGPSVQRLLGYSPEQVTGRNAFDYIHPADAERVAASLRRALTHPERPISVQFRFRHRAGHWLTLQSIGRHIPDSSTECLFVVNSRDVTQHLALEQQLAQSQKMQAVGTLAGGIAHDFNNILAAMLGNAEMARLELGPGHPAAESVGEILRAGKRAKDLVQRIISFSRPHEHQLRPIQMAFTVREAIDLLRSTLPAGVEIELSCAPDLPWALADPSQVHQVVLNLATNAWHAMDGSPGRIEIRLEVCTVERQTSYSGLVLEPGMYLRLSVIDTGKGMDAATLERIFEPFFTTKPPGRGAGLGLAVVHGILRAHRGSIAVESEVGVGSSFRLYFPARTETFAEEAAPPAPAPARGNGERILYLDDEESLVDLASRYLQRQGFEVEGFTRPEEAIARFRAESPQFDVVITDFNMPGSSGMEVVRRLLEIRPDAAIILASGYLNSDEIQAARELGVREILLKPAGIDELGRVVPAVLRACTLAGSADKPAS